MYPVIVPLYGPIAIHSYGLAIAIGIWLFIWCIENSTDNNINIEPMRKAIVPGICAGIFGGKLLYVIETWYAQMPLTMQDIFGGFSLLGATAAVIITLYWYLRDKDISLITIFDTFACYAPILHIFGRIGCFFAGCCHGMPTYIPWAITYTHAMSLAPCHVPLHPAQLYSAGLHIIIFSILHYLRRYHRHGIVTAGYCSLLGIERFLTDFWRADHAPLHASLPLSHTQCLSLFFVASGFFYGALMITKHMRYDEHAL